jgi:hypothetical protein
MALGLVGASLWHGILQRGGQRERAGSGIELKTSLGNKKKTDTPTWYWGNKKKTDTHRLCFGINGTNLKLCRYAFSEKHENLGIAPPVPAGEAAFTRQLVL